MHVGMELIDVSHHLGHRGVKCGGDLFAEIGMAVQAMSGPAMFQALQSGALDAGEFIGPWTDSALGYHQVAKNYYWPGIGEPSSAEDTWRHWWCGALGHRAPRRVLPVDAPSPSTASALRRLLTSLPSSRPWPEPQTWLPGLKFDIPDRVGVRDTGL